MAQRCLRALVRYRIDRLRRGGVVRVGAVVNPRRRLPGDRRRDHRGRAGKVRPGRGRLRPREHQLRGRLCRHSDLSVQVYAGTTRSWCASSTKWSAGWTA